MDKILTFPTQSEQGIFLYTVGEGRDHGYLTKTASAAFHPEIAKYIDQAKPIPGKTQVLLTALGAGEYYSSNVNGDFFPEEALKHYGKDYGYKTFEEFAKVYKHHVNKDPLKSYGDVVLSVWNEKMKRVELIVILDNAKAPDLVERINNAEYPEISMGCKVPFDVCSICGNKAKTRAQYCDHLRYHINRIPPGHTKKAYAINTLPKFFDISFVLIGADRIAKVMKKVAHLHPKYGVSSAEDFEKLAFGLDQSKVAARKIAEITKEVPSNTESNAINLEHLEALGRDGSEALRPLEPELPKKVIIQITSSCSQGIEGLNKILSTMSMLGVVPKPREFQALALRSLGKSSLADQLDSSGICFDPCATVPNQSRFDGMLNISPRNFDDTVFHFLKPFLAEKSYARPLLGNRIIRLVKLAESGNLVYPNTEHVKTASNEDSKKMGLMPMMLLLAGLYVAAGKKAPEAATSGLDGLLGKHPGLAAALGIGAVASMNALFQRNVVGKFDSSPNKSPMPNLSWQQDIARKNQNPIFKTAMDKEALSLGKRIFLGVPSLYMLSGALEVKKARNPHEPEGKISSFFRKHPDMASAALIGEKMIGAPISGRLGKVFKSVAMPKVASLTDTALSTALYSAAFPGKSIALRGASWLADSAIIAGISKLLSKKKQQ